VHYVLRRKPPGPLLPGAHAIEREVRVMKALSATGFPVPHIFALCEETEVIGTPFYIMEMVEGRIFWDATFPEVSLAERSAYFGAMNETLARLHSIDPTTIGLGDYGKRGDYFVRQISRWTQQYLADDLAGRDPNMDYMIEWLPAHIPASDASAVVHGDFRCDNMVFHPTEPRIVAVLDWELSTLGHPFADFAYHAMMYRTPPHIVAGLAGADLKALGIPSESRYVGDYCRRTGMTDTDYPFALAFNFFRLAAIFHGIKGRAIRGTAASSEAQVRAQAFPELAALAVAQTRL
jgi:aminoglycoside phosphotransferase (APT) family kinase protein